MRLLAAPGGRGLDENFDVEVHPPIKPLASGGAEITEPPDSFDWFKNLKALGLCDRLLALGLMALTAALIVVNTGVGVHDQIVTESQTFIYSQYDSDGDSSSPLGKALGVDGAIAAGRWLAIRRVLRRYMTFRQGKLPRPITRDTVVSIAQLVQGRARVDLFDATLRIVACNCNLECGQHRRGSGTDVHTVSFETPVRAMVLYEETVFHLPAQEPITRFFDGEVDFGPLFDRLYSPCTTSTSHGIKLYWEAQLLHDELVDQELVLPVSALSLADFYEAS